MPTIMDFKAMMDKRGGFARPNLFKVAISKIKADKQLDYQMRCFQAQIPGHNISTTDKDIGSRSVAYQKIFSDIILGFYVDSSLDTLHFWQDWIDLIIVRANPNRHNYYDNYTGEVKVTQENRSGEEVATWTFHDAYPKQIDPIQLDYGTNDAVMTCNATITYRHFTVKFVEVVKKENKKTNEEAQYTQSVRTDMNKIDPMLEIINKKENWKFKDNTSDEFDTSDYPEWDEMDAGDKERILEWYRLHGSSKSGGALHMVDKIQ